MGLYEFEVSDYPKAPRIDRLIAALYREMPQIEAARAVLITESYLATEAEPVILRRAKAFAHIMANLPIIIRDEELIVGSTTIAPRGCQTYPEFSYEWLEAEFDTVSTRSADPFFIAEDTKEKLRKVHRYWKGKTTSELATCYMEPETLLAMKHNIFTPGNYFYNGIGHICVKYDKVLAIGYGGIKREAEDALCSLSPGDGDYVRKSRFLQAVIISCDAAITYANRYADLAESAAKAFDKGAKNPLASCPNRERQKELFLIAANCRRVPEYGAANFYEACQAFWFVQQLIQIESSGHSISPGRFDQYMYPYYLKDLETPGFNKSFAQELMDLIWVKLNDLNKCRDAVSAEGFAGYSLFQNLICGGQNEDGLDVTNDLSFMCINASKHVALPQPSLSVRVWNSSPHEFLIKAAELTQTGVGLPAYFNDEVIIPSLQSMGLTLSHARDYCIIGCVEPQKAGMTDGWHDAAFFNMCRPLEMVFSEGMEAGEKVGASTKPVETMTEFEEFYDAYKEQMNYFIKLLVNANNAIDAAHGERCPLPFLSAMVDDCIKKAKSVQEGGARYNFTGPQGFGVANMADALYAVKELVFDKRKITLAELKEMLIFNFGHGLDDERLILLTASIAKKMQAEGQTIGEKEIAAIMETALAASRHQTVRERGTQIREWINEIPKFGNDEPLVDALARDVAYVYSKPLLHYRNPRGGTYQAGLYPVSANVPMGAKTGATPDGRLAGMPVADGVSPSSGKDVNGPTAAANSVAKLDHFIASNGTLFNQKFHPSALSGKEGLNKFVALIRTYFDLKGSHMQFNVISKETLIDAQKNPENYQQLVIRVAGYSALFTTLSRSLQDEIICRTEHN